MSISQTSNQRIGILARLTDAIADQKAVIRKIDPMKGGQAAREAHERLFRLEGMLKALRRMV